VALSDLFRPGTALTWRRLKVLVDGLPPESLTMTALRVKGAGSGGVVEAGPDVEPGDAPHSRLEMLVIQLTDAVYENTWAVFQSQTSETIPRPDPIPRPGVRAAKRQAPKDPLLVEWLTRRQNGEDTADLDELLNLQNVTPLRPYRPGGDDGGHGTGRQP
jgi:hypothetical protein